MLSKTFCLFLPLQQRFGMLGSLKSKSSLDTYQSQKEKIEWFQSNGNCSVNAINRFGAIIHQCGKCRLKLLHHNEVHFCHSGLLIRGGHTDVEKKSTFLVANRTGSWTVRVATTAALCDVFRSWAFYRGVLCTEKWAFLPKKVISNFCHFLMS